MHYFCESMIFIRSLKFKAAIYETSRVHLNIIYLLIMFSLLPTHNKMISFSSFVFTNSDHAYKTESSSQLPISVLLSASSVSLSERKMVTTIKPRHSLTYILFLFHYCFALGHTLPAMSARATLPHFLA